MIAALLTLTLAAAPSGDSGPHVPAAAPVPAALRGADVRASLQLTATHFAARSLVPFEQWVVFEDRSAGLRTTRGLAPYGELLYPIARPEDAWSMTVEVVSEDASGARSSSVPVTCRAFLDTALFLSGTEGGLEGWISRHGGRSLTRVDAPAALHVPVPVPSEDKQRRKKRKVEGKKLPPL